MCSIFFIDLHVNMSEVIKFYCLPHSLSHLLVFQHSRSNYILKKCINNLPQKIHFAAREYVLFFCGLNQKATQNQSQTINIY